MWGKLVRPSLRYDRLCRIPRRPTGAMLPAGFLLKCPLTRNANSVFRRKGGASPNGKGGAQSRTGGAGGLPGCTSEALRARKLGRDRTSRRRASLTARGILPRIAARAGERGGSRPAGPQRSGAREHAVAGMATCPNPTQSVRQTFRFIEGRDFCRPCINYIGNVNAYTQDEKVGNHFAACAALIVQVAMA